MAYQRLSVEEKEQRKKELMQKVEDIIDNFQHSPADLIEYLKFNSKFYQYSKNNNALIYQENKYAQYCGSFKHFKDMGYSVKKGERGIKILVPYISKYFYNADTEEWKKVSEATSEQKLKIKNGEIEIKQYTSFGVGTVFDISQTNCPVEDYPKFFGFGHASKSHRELFNAVKYYAENKGIPVEILDLKSITLSGEYNAVDNSIALSDKLQDDRLLSVMTHELSHAMLHNSELLENVDKNIMQIEFEADALSLLLREHLGISDIEDARQAHLQTSFKKYMEWAEENESEQHCPTLSEILDNINEAYSSIVEDFDNSISHYFELHSSIEQSLNTTNDFSKTIDDFLNGKINPTDHIFVCSTTEVMKVCGADNLDVMIYQDTIRKILSDDLKQFEHPHNLSVETLKQLPIQLQRPIMVFKGSHEGSIVLVTDLQNANSEQIIVSCELDSGSEWNKINRITSMYGKENIANYLNAQIKKDNLIGCQKNIANQMLHSVGLYLPSENTFIDYSYIISDIEGNVNKYNFGDGLLNIDAIKAALNEYSSQKVLEMLNDEQIDLFMSYAETSRYYSEPMHDKLEALYLDISEYLEYQEYENDLAQKSIDTLNKQTVVVNCFAGPGAGKTTCAWEIASELKKRGIEAEYVGEYAKELVWDGNTELLDGSLQSQQKLYDVQNHRVQRLLGKVDVVVTDSPAIMGAMYLKEQNAAFEQGVISDFNKQHNFNLFINRGDTFQQTGRIHNLEESKAIDNSIKAFLDRYDIFYGTYNHSTINKVVDNIETHLEKVNSKLSIDRNAENLIYDADTDELEKLYNISLKLNEQNLHPIDVLQDKSLIDFYSFSCNINNSESTKEFLWKIFQNDMQVVAVVPAEKGFVLNCIKSDYTVHQFNSLVYTTKEAALTEVYRNSQIAKLVEPEDLDKCSIYKDLSILSETENLKYPYIQIHWTDSEHLKGCDCISIDAANEKFSLANETVDSGVQNTSFSLHLSDSAIYNFKYAHSPEGQKILEYIKSHLDEIQSDQALDKSLAALNSYITNQMATNEQLNHQSIQSLDSFDTTEYPL